MNNTTKINKKCRFIPSECYKNIYEIDYNKLYSIGKKIILFDLDNTIITYHDSLPSIEMIELVNNLKKIGFIVLIMSNNHSKRLKMVGEALNIEAIANSKKPFKHGYKKLIKRFKDYTNSSFVAIGDQIITDIYGANRMGIYSILVKPLYLDDEHWYTKINRFMEKRIIKGIKKIDLDQYKKIKECQGEQISE